MLKGIIVNISVFIILCSLVVSCASVPKASKEFETKALSFAPPPGQASIYVYRPYSFLAGGALFEISLDYKKIGNIKTETYIFGNINSGSHIVGSQYFGANQIKPISFNANAGSIYFFRVIPAMGGASIEMVNSDEGVRDIKSYTLSGDNLFEFESNLKTSP